MFLISTVTITDVYQIHNTGILGWMECHLWNSEFVYFGLFVSSTWNIVVLTIERFVTIRNEVAKGMFLHVSVILFTGEGGACIAGGIPACLAAGGSTPGGGSCSGGVPALGMVCSGMGGVGTPSAGSRRLLLRTVRILLYHLLFNVVDDEI